MDIPESVFSSAWLLPLRSLLRSLLCMLLLMLPVHVLTKALPSLGRKTCGAMSRWLASGSFIYKSMCLIPIDPFHMTDHVSPQGFLHIDE